VQLSDLLKEDRMCARDVLYTLSLDRRSRKAREVDRMSGIEGLADFTDALEAANARPLPGTRVNDKHGTLAVVDLDAIRRNNAQ
jgi:hypothetical protein